MEIKNSWNPQQYEKFKAQRSQPFFDLMSLVEVQKGLKVVDLGCGTGELTSELHRHLEACETLGIDSSSEMLKKADAFASEGLSFKNADISKWQESNSFDVIFSNAALQWCSGHEEIFGRLQKSLKAGGQLAIQMPMNHDYPTHILANAMSLEDKWKKVLLEGPRQSQTIMMPIENYAALLYKLGFSEQKVFLRVYDHVLDSREGVIEWVKGTLLNYYESRLTPENYAQFVKEFRERLFEQLPDERPFFYPFKRALLWAKLTPRKKDL